MSTSDRSGVHGRAWQFALTFGTLATLVLLAWYWPTALSIEAIWRRSGNFTHGYVIVPIAAYMVWTLKTDIARLTPKPAWLALLIALAAVGLWAAGRLVDVQVAQQLALVLMVQAVWIAVLGWQLAWLLIVPLLYLFFAVPFGQGLEPVLQEYTAWFSVKALQLTGIPVLREGLFITIPSGAFEVAEACSGIRYLVASLALGVLYAFLNFHSWRYRLLFVTLAIIVPIIANGIRAYLIIILAHVSDHKLAVGIDHLVYGWLFFGLVMYLLFLFGNRLRLRENPPSAAGLPVNANTAVSLQAIVLSGLLSVIIVLSAKPVYAGIFAHENTTALKSLKLPAAVGRWQHFESPPTDWTSSYPGADLVELGSYQRAGGNIDYATYYFANQRQGAELGGANNHRYSTDRWRRLSSTLRVVDVGGQPLSFVEERIRSRYGRERLVWRIYWVSGQFSNTSVMVKLLEARARVTGKYQGSAALLFSVAAADVDIKHAQQVLTEFVAQSVTEFDTALKAVKP